MYNRFLLPTEGSKNATHAVEYAFEIATHHDAIVHALFVIDTQELGIVTPAEVELDEVRSSVRRTGEQILKDVTERGAERDLSIVTALETGIPHQTITDYAEEHDIDLIVMGTHGRTGLNHVLLGSVTERVVRTSPVPVLTVRRNQSLPR